MKYSELLKLPEWQKKRLEILDDRGWSCEFCCDKTNQLHVHHTTYIKGKNPWEYEDHHYYVFCKTCHTIEHENHLVNTTIPLIHKLGYTNMEIEVLLIYAFNKLLGEYEK